ncbi:ATPase [Achromobacter sp. KS-M25]|nr:ATPase [Achromobacter aestuarii]
MPLVISAIHAENYRTLKRITLPTANLNVFIGANGVGKTNLYRALQLIQAAAAGTLSHELAAEGGMASVLHAGERSSRKPVRLTLRVELADARTACVEYAYEVSVGLKAPTSAAFDDEPLIKQETLRQFQRGRSYTLMDRKNGALTLLDENGVKVQMAMDLLASETALANVQDADRFPALQLIRRTLLDWRFYHGFRTDRDAMLRRDCFAVAAPTLASDGGNLAAVFATLAHIREDKQDLDDAISDAFPGARLVIPVPHRYASFGLQYPDYPQRVFEPLELSDGTLHYLALCGALLAYRLPAFVALNEPETSLHPDLIDPLARLIVRASQRTQVWLVTHSQALADALATHGGVPLRQVVKTKGATWIDGLTLGGDFSDDRDPVPDDEWHDR